MKIERIAIAAVIATALVSGCESTDPSVFEDATVTADLAASAGEAYPTRPIRMIVASGAGGGLDFVARLVAPKLT